MMVTVHPLPTLRQITDWDVQHLLDAANHWSHTAELWEGTFHSVWQATVRPGGTNWEGGAADAAQDAAWRDLVRVRGCADSLRIAARIAQIGAESLLDVKRLTLNAIDEARTSELVVRDDLSVTGIPKYIAGGPNPTAGEYAEDITHLAANLVALDHEIALRLHTAALGISDGLPYLARSSG